MSRIREDYEKTAWRRLVHFINGDEEDMTEEAGYEVETEATTQRIQDEFFEDAEWNLQKEKADTMLAQYKEWPETKGVAYFNKMYNLVYYTSL